MRRSLADYNLGLGLGGKELAEATAQKWNIQESLLGLNPQSQADPHHCTQAG